MLAVSAMLAQPYDFFNRYIGLPAQYLVVASKMAVALRALSGYGHAKLCKMPAGA